jgi:hypothetical protein
MMVNPTFVDLLRIGFLVTGMTSDCPDTANAGIGLEIMPTNSIAGISAFFIDLFISFSLGIVDFDLQILPRRQVSTSSR